MKFNNLIIFLFLFYSLPVFAQTSLDYANYLMDEGDYFRAISEYKRCAFNTDDEDLKRFCNWQISKAYYKSQKFRSSVKTLNLILKHPVSSNDFHTKENVLLGLNYYRMKNFASAEYYFKSANQYDSTGISGFYLALIDVEYKYWRSAESKYDSIIQKYPNTVLAQQSQILKYNLSSANTIPQKNPFLSASLSSVIPGAGQMYSKHYYDGLQAFFFVGAFACASYISYRYDHKISNNYLMTGVSVSITSVFHLANIIGAYKTAQYYNIKNKETFTSGFRKQAFQVEPDF